MLALKAGVIRATARWAGTLTGHNVHTEAPTAILSALPTPVRTTGAIGGDTDPRVGHANLSVGAAPLYTTRRVGAFASRLI